MNYKNKFNLLTKQLDELGYNVELVTKFEITTRKTEPVQTKETVTQTTKRIRRDKPYFDGKSRSCSVCKEIKLVAEFSKDIHNSTGYTSNCKVCRMNSARKKQKTRKRQKSYYERIKNDTFLCAECNTFFEGESDRSAHSHSTKHTPMINVTTMLNKNGAGAQRQKLYIQKSLGFNDIEFAIFKERIKTQVKQYAKTNAITY